MIFLEINNKGEIDLNCLSCESIRYSTGRTHTRGEKRRIPLKKFTCCNPPPTNGIRLRRDLNPPCYCKNWRHPTWKFGSAFRTYQRFIFYIGFKHFIIFFLFEWKNGRHVNSSQSIGARKRYSCIIYLPEIVIFSLVLFRSLVAAPCSFEFEGKKNLSSRTRLLPRPGTGKDRGRVRMRLGKFSAAAPSTIARSRSTAQNSFGFTHGLWQWDYPTLPTSLLHGFDHLCNRSDSKSCVSTVTNDADW